MTISSIPFSSQLRRFLIGTSALLAFTTQVACTNLTSTMTHVDGRAVEIVEAGAGDPTVVFESGLGNDWTPWDDAASEVAGQARVFAYSRPGYGDSDPTNAPRTATRIVEDLRALLAAQNVAPPYVLVGHSFGGTYMELFAKAHPEEVAGLVAVDTRHRDFTTACQKAKFDGCTLSASMVDSMPEVDQAEFRAFASASDEIQAAGTFGHYPVRVLTATSHSFDPEAEPLWISMQGSLADEASDGKQIIFEGADHNLESNHAHEVAKEILSIVSAAKN